MKNNFRIINFLRKLFYFFFVIVAIKLSVGVCVKLVCVFFPSVPISGGEIHFYGEAYTQSDISYQLLGDVPFSGQSDVALRLRGVKSDDLLYRVVRLFDFAIVNLLALFLLLNAYRLFARFSNNYQIDTFFSWDGYRNIKRIAFLLLGLWIYAIINGLLFSFLFVKNVVVQGLDVSFHPDLVDVPGLLTVLVVFVFAEIYRSGILLKEDAKLTI